MSGFALRKVTGTPMSFFVIEFTVILIIRPPCVGRRPLKNQNSCFFLFDLLGPNSPGLVHAAMYKSRLYTRMHFWPRFSAQVFRNREEWADFFETCTQMCSSTIDSLYKSDYRQNAITSKEFPSLFRNSPSHDVLYVCDVRTLRLFLK